MYTTILGPLDGSKLGECSLEHVKGIATGCHVSEVILLTVLEPVTATDFHMITTSRTATEEIGKQQDKIEKEQRKQAELYLANAASSLKKEGISVKTVIVPIVSGRGAAEEILDYAGKNKVDLIVMSTHGRSGISRWAMGSVSDKVVHYAKVPVLTVTPTGCRL